MKTKLLKKVRKRYSIVRIDEKPKYKVPYEVTYAVNRYKLPVYIIRDKYNRRYTEYSNSRELAMGILISWVLEDYSWAKDNLTFGSKVWGI